MKQRRNAVLWAIGWWIVRRQIRRRATVAFADVGASATSAARGGRFRAVLGAIALVGVLAGGFVVARRLLAGPEEPEGLETATPPAVPEAPTEQVPGTEPA